MKVAVSNEDSLVWEIQNIHFISVLLNKWWCHLRSGVCSIYCVSAFWSTECPLQGGKCLWVCEQRAAGGICVSVLFTSWLRRQRLEWRCNVCTLLSSLYSNDRPCCFTCCGGRSAPCDPLSKTRTQVLPVAITCFSPYVLRPLTEQQLRLRGTTETELLTSQSFYRICVDHAWRETHCECLCVVWFMCCVLLPCQWLIWFIYWQNCYEHVGAWKGK